MNESYYYTNDFQDLILAALCRKPSEFAAVHELLQPEYFFGLEAFVAMEQLKDFHAKWRKFPTFIELGQYVDDRFPPEDKQKAKEVLEYVKKLSKLTVRNVPYIRDRVVHFCRERALMNAIKESWEAIKTGKWPDGGFAPVFDQAVRIGHNVEDLGFSFSDDVEKVVTELTSSYFGVKTGWQKLDENWYNGWGPGWLVVPLAPPKSYKSTFCTNLALNMTEGGADRANEHPVDVLYYACEISAQLTLARAYCAASGQEMSLMYREPKKFIAQTEKALAKRWKRGGGAILAKGFAAKEATIADIRAHALQAVEYYDFHPRVIFIDHAETVRTSKRSERASDWRQQADIYAEARALGAELNATVVMPDRCNRDTVGKLPSMKSFQGSFEKAGVVDVAIGLCQSDEERAEAENKAVVPIRYFIFLNRHGEPCGYYLGQVTKKTMRMTLDETMSYAAAMKEYEEEVSHKTWSSNRQKGAPSSKMTEDPHA